MPGELPLVSPYYKLPVVVLRFQIALNLPISISSTWPVSIEMPFPYLLLTEITLLLRIRMEEKENTLMVKLKPKPLSSPPPSKQVGELDTHLTQDLELLRGLSGV